MLDPANDNEGFRQAMLDAIALRRLREWTMVFDSAGEAGKAAYMRGAVALMTGDVTGESAVDGLRSLATSVNGPPSPLGLQRNS